MMTIMIMMTSMESNDGFEFSKNINRKQGARVDLEGGKGGKKSLRKGDVRKAAAVLDPKHSAFHNHIQISKDTNTNKYTYKYKH